MTSIIGSKTFLFFSVKTSIKLLIEISIFLVMHLLPTRPIWELKRSSLNAIILQKIIKRTWKNVIKVIQMPAEPKPEPRSSKSWSSGPFLLYQCDSSFYLTKQGCYQIAHPEKTTSHVFFKILIGWLLQVSHYARYYG